ncbi:MAG TPA: HDOD domain-containing protein [Leptospiraceae bacterium]|nr:HDOD domain-containing protein [Leptospiraceae bacterium]HNF28074.1 HDOD domain-containing protein [Leptospiraceae bacterium]HNO21892.1 HDOD domain-containing protein [Leptospiraceae bacterium]
MFVGLNEYEKIVHGKSSTVKTKFFSEESLLEYYNFFILILTYLDQIYLVEITFTIIKEMLINAQKANAKRLLFQRLGLDINDLNQYKKGMALFSEEVSMKWGEQESYLKNSDFYIETRIEMTPDTLKIEIENNASVLPIEQERITKRLSVAKKYNDLSDAFADMLDTSESAGLGLVLTQILLRNSGIGQENLKLNFHSDKTVVDLIIPKNAAPVSIESRLGTKILDEISNLPHLPQSLSRIIQLCNNPDSSINTLSAEIEKDPALSADLLKLSNSSSFITRNKVNNVLGAIKIVGLKNLRNMLYVTGVTKILNSRYQTKAQEVWDHSAKCSFFAKALAQEYGKNRYADVVATAGLLHDLGKLVLLSVDRKLAQKVDFLKGKEKNNSVLLEEVSMGVTHPEIGGLLLRKWGFPEELISVVEFHHKPFLAPDHERELVEIIYLANMMIDVIDNKASYFVIYTPVLKNFKLENEEAFRKLLEKISKQFELVR